MRHMSRPVHESGQTHELVPAREELFQGASKLAHSKAPFGRIDVKIYAALGETPALPGRTAVAHMIPD